MRADDSAAGVARAGGSESRSGGWGWAGAGFTDGEVAGGGVDTCIRIDDRALRAVADERADGFAG